MKKRSRGRELALQFLYQLDLRGPELACEASEFLASQESDREARSFALKLITGAHEHTEEINGVIQGVAQNWDIARMAVIDRNVLRLRYSTQNSGAFINGILDKIKTRHTQAAPKEADASEPAAPELES